MPRRPALGLFVAQPNPSVANSVRFVEVVFALTIAAQRYKQMAPRKKIVTFLCQFRELIQRILERKP